MHFSTVCLVLLLCLRSWAKYQRGKACVEKWQRVGKLRGHLVRKAVQR